MTKSKANPETMREHHLRATIWEGVRVEYFRRHRNDGKALECGKLQQHHRLAAQQAAIDASKLSP